MNSVNWDAIVKTYDVRGLVGKDLTVEVVEALAAGFVDELGCAGSDVVVGHDMRDSSPEFAAAFARGAQARGANVVSIGLCSTDESYFASGVFEAPAAMFTASHNPAQYNGIKLCLSGARPVGVDTGLLDIKEIARAVLAGRGPAPSGRVGRTTERDLLSAFADHVVSFVDPSSLRPMRVVADTANGMGGLVVPAVFERLPRLELEVMYPELDGTFPNHPADPLQSANQRDLQARVVAGGFDVGLAFDGDADRVFVVDELGRGLSGSTTTAILASRMLAKNPGSTILHNLICSRAVPEVIRENGGVPVRTKVGHSFIKQTMAETGAVFGGEHSAHYYFADNYRADSGLIATMLVLEALSASNDVLSDLRKPFERYSSSGEINTQVDDTSTVIEAVAAHYGDQSQDRLDGLTVDCGPWWFNLRPSNTEPLLRLNLEAPTRAECDEHVAEVLALITAV